MKHVYKNWLVKATIGFAAITSIRLLSTVLHMTTLDKLYKPRDFRKTSHLKIDQKIIDDLPKFSQTVLGQQMDPINILLVGTENGIRYAFEKAGWHTAHPSSPVHLLLGFLSSITNRPYKSGPFTPHFINIGLQDLAFQKDTQLKTFRQRHHVRIWRTKHELPNGKRLWIAAASYDTRLRLSILPPFVHHHIDPMLDTERAYIVDQLIQQGCLLGDTHRMIPAISRKNYKRNATGAKYYTDGRATVLEIV